MVTRILTALFAIVIIVGVLFVATHHTTSPTTTTTPSTVPTTLPPITGITVPPTTAPATTTTTAPAKRLTPAARIATFTPACQRILRPVLPTLNRIVANKTVTPAQVRALDKADQSASDVCPAGQYNAFISLLREASTK